MKAIKTEDFRVLLFMDIKHHANILEIAKYKEDTFKGSKLIPESKIKFEPLNLQATYMKVLNNLRGFSTPQKKLTNIGWVFSWGGYLIRVKKA